MIKLTYLVYLLLNQRYLFVKGKRPLIFNIHNVVTIVENNS